MAVRAVSRVGLGALAGLIAVIAAVLAWRGATSARVRGDVALPGAVRSAEMPQNGIQWPERSWDGDVQLLAFDTAARSRALRWIVDSTPLATIGGPTQPEHDLSGLYQAVFLSDGRIAVLSYGGPELRVYAPDGRTSAVIGRPGEGPGEWRAPRSLVWSEGDTLLIPDIGTQRLSRVVADEGVVSTVSLAGRLAPRDGYAVGELSGGQIIFAPFGRISDSVVGSRFRPATDVLVLPIDGAAEAVASVPGVESVEMATHYEGRSGREAFPLGLGRQTYVTVWQDWIVIAPNDGYAFELRDSTGTVRERITVAAAAQPVTEAMRVAERRRWREYLSGATERLRDAAETNRLLDARPFADSLPWYGGVLPAPDGLLWVVDPWVPGDSTWQAVAFRADGAMVRRVSAASSGRPIAFGPERVLLGFRDPDGVVTLKAFAMPTAAGGS